MPPLCQQISGCLWRAAARVMAKSKGANPIKVRPFCLSGNLSELVWEYVEGGNQELSARATDDDFEVYRKSGWLVVECAGLEAILFHGREDVVIHVRANGANDLQI